ncbi:uncharacterized protein LOC123533793 [Mercenaria mercenaria]|uniref:uncharacterized protein LOC123533793 n=1 Tax=Mercenaria mercenaria TaxID=6596 RepID=UPI00234EF797|nr:uncharacterized protein LOC123533793 [Mercenaria mercenaria]
MSGNILKSLLQKCVQYCKGGNVKSKRNMAQHKDDVFLQIGDFKVFAWSISGIETSVVVRKPSDGFDCCFDMGYSSRENVKCQSVMISHGHMDHISAVPQHIKKRELLGGKPASYYVPEHLVEDVQELCNTYAKICENSEGLKAPNICGVKQGDRIKLHKGHFAVPFPTVHRVKSQGYIVYSAKKQLNPEFQGLSSKEIGARIRDGENVHTDPVITPEIAFTGDTTFQVFTNEVYDPPPDLFKVKLLIVEATYINDDCNIEERVQQARKWGHIHLSEIYENAELFKDVDNILLIHMSDKYSCRYIQEKVFSNIPEALKGKVHVSTIAKERYL